MNTPCTKLHLFVDGELSATEAEAFRHHLTRCAECEVGLRDLLQLEMLASRALEGTGVEEAEASRKVTPLRPWLHQAYRAAVPVALAAGLAAVGVFHFQAEPELPGEVWLANATERQLDARLSHPKADRFRPFVPLRGTTHTAEVLPLRPLAELEERQDFQGIAAAYALRGDWQQAEAFLTRAPDSADKDNDLAVVAMSRGRWEDALGLLGGALRREPKHAQALWNRGLALQGRGLKRLAEVSFREAAALPEQEEGWRQEAQGRAADLHDSLETEGARWRKQVLDASTRLAQGTADLKELMRQPALAREAFYEAVRTAPSAAAVTALTPVAKELDRVGGGSVLQDYVKDIAARDFAVRAPLAGDYAKLLNGDLTPGLLDTLRRSQEWDLYFGALVHTGAAAKDAEALKALARFAHASRDPWLTLLADRERAWSDDMRGRASAEQLLLNTLRTCEAYTRLFNCTQIN
ncbi:zf-HC2 domain-containing protein [Pyxidicoccus fallax]|uniref:Zf-HC2 domain-containing protein n=1 Tax=Pyxidicoccus fallax TaxID=394095 RepID=A0A848LI48_9BACT|nr:zf-HC2 domain-containing protein [Pyxidicoccus fallax]NMO17368.1 zf-HC2 domain-containing protein [Pyxidicoccus fallax]NPC86654.1 zf-HC2 domain-containing protein [Pyxidicoccus fallax]